MSAVHAHIRPADLLWGKINLYVIKPPVSGGKEPNTMSTDTGAKTCGTAPDWSSAGQGGRVEGLEEKPVP